MEPDLSRRSVKSKYKIIARVGSGTYGVVYKAKSLLTNQLVALKKFSTRTLDKTGQPSTELEDFPITAIREIKLLKLLNHKNIISLWGVMPTKPSAKNGYCGSVYLVFEYMEHDLLGLITSKVIFSMPQIKCFLRQLLEGVIYLHQNKIIHRDLKSANILLNNKGEVKIADFGLSRQMSTNPEYTNKVVTLWYRAPELLLGAVNYSSQIDIWSIGCILGELFIGNVLFQEGTEPKQIEKIFEICGTPDKFNWPEAEKLCKYKELGPKFPRERKLKRYIRERKPDLDELALDLLDKFLIIDPKERITGEEAILHPFFKNDPLPCPLDDMPKPKQECHETLVKKKYDEMYDRNRNPPQRGPPKITSQKFKDYRPVEPQPPPSIISSLNPPGLISLASNPALVVRPKPYSIPGMPWGSAPSVGPGLPRGILMNPTLLPMNPILGIPADLTHIPARMELEEPSDLRSLLPMRNPAYKFEPEVNLKTGTLIGKGLVCFDTMHKKSKSNPILIQDNSVSSSKFVSAIQAKVVDKQIEKKVTDPFENKKIGLPMKSIIRIEEEMNVNESINKEINNKKALKTNNKQPIKKAIIIQPSSNSNSIDMGSGKKPTLLKIDSSDKKDKPVKPTSVVEPVKKKDNGIALAHLKKFNNKSQPENKNSKKKGRGRKKISTADDGDIDGNESREAEVESKNSMNLEKSTLYPSTGSTGVKALDITEHFQARTRHQKMELKEVLSEVKDLILAEEKPKKKSMDLSEEKVKGKTIEFSEIKREDITENPIEKKVDPVDEKLKVKSTEIPVIEGNLKEKVIETENPIEKINSSLLVPKNNHRGRGRPRKVEDTNNMLEKEFSSDKKEKLNKNNPPLMNSAEKLIFGSIQNLSGENQKQPYLPIQMPTTIPIHMPTLKPHEVMFDSSGIESVSLELEEEIEEREPSPVLPQKRKVGRPPKDKNLKKKLKKN